MIPATERETHYFFCHTSDAVTCDPGLAAPIKMPVLLSTDSGAVRARRALDNLIAAKQQQSG